MRRITRLHALAEALGALATACQGPNAHPDLSPSPDAAAVAQAPAWYLKPPVETDYVIVAATATSRDMQTALDKAQLTGRGALASQMESKLEGLGKRFSEESGATAGSDLIQSYSQATKAIVSTVLSGSRAREQVMVREADIYRAYVLMELPIGRANAALMQRLRGNEQMYTRLRATQAFKDLEKDVARYEASGPAAP